MNPAMGELDQRLASVERRIRAMQALEEGARFALLATPITLGVAAARIAFQEGTIASLDERDGLILALAPVAVAALGGVLRGVLRPVSRERAAALAEERSAAGATFTTALEVAAKGHAWRSLVEAEADTLARSLEPARVLPLGLPRRTRAVALLVLAALGAFFFPVERLRASAPEPEKPVEKPALDAIAKAGERLREASQSLPPGDERRSLDETGKELRGFLADLEAGRLGKREALAKLGEAEEKLRVERGRAAARRDVREALEGERDLAPLARSQKADVDAVAKKLARDPVAREKARKTLGEAARAAAETPELHAALERAEHALEPPQGEKPVLSSVEGTPDEIKPPLEALAKTLAAQPSKNDEARTRAELEKARAAVEQARGALTGEKPLPTEQSEKATDEKPVANETPAPFEGTPAAGKEKMQQLVAKALEEAAPRSEKPGAQENEKPDEKKPPLSAEDAQKLLDKLPKETLEKLAQAAQEPEKPLPDEVKKEIQETARNEAPKPDEEREGIPPEALARMAELVPPEVIAKAMKLAQERQQEKQQEGASEKPPISPEDAQKVLEKLSPKTLEKLAKAALELQKNAPPSSEGKRPGMSPEQAQELVKKLPQNVVDEIRKAAQSSSNPGSSNQGSNGSSGLRETHTGDDATTGNGHGNGNGNGTTGNGNGNGNGNGTTAVPSPTPGPNGTAPGPNANAGGVGARQRADGNPQTAGNQEPPSRVVSPGNDARPGDSSDELVKNKARLDWATAPGELPADERAALRASLDKRRVPPSRERTVRDYFDLGKP
jgi:hypothetical protein